MAGETEGISFLIAIRTTDCPRVLPQGADREDVGEYGKGDDMGVGEQKYSSRRSTRPESGSKLAKPACTYKRPAGTALTVSRKRERESRQRETAVAETAVRRMGSRKKGN